MNVYTAPKRLGVASAVGALPSLSLDDDPDADAEHKTGA